MRCWCKLVVMLVSTKALVAPPPSSSSSSRKTSVRRRAQNDDALLEKLTRTDVVEKAVMEWSSVGDGLKKANRLSGGSATLTKAEVEKVTEDGLEIVTTVERRSYFGQVQKQEKTVTVPFRTDGKLQSKLVAMACGLRLHRDAAFLSDGMFAKVKENMWLNNVPASRDTRRYLYSSMATAVVEALKQKKRRCSLFAKPPELDDELDTYRVGTLLELTRALAISIIKDLGFKVRIAVQAPMGTGTFQGMPLSLNGVRRLLESMDYGENTAELFKKKLIRFGAVSNKEEDLDDDDDVLIVLAPQSTVGCPIVPLLQDMAIAAKDRPVILLNPKLKDVMSSGAVMNYLGRDERIAFAESFDEVFRFETVVEPGRTFFPILGSVIRHGPDLPYVVYERRESGSFKGGSTSSEKAKAVRDGTLVESYNPVALYTTKPDPGSVLSALRRSS